MASFQHAFAVPGMPNHPHSASQPIMKSEAFDIASKVVEKLVEKGILPRSWRNVRPVGAEKKVYNNTKEWVVMFDNRRIPDPSKRRVYVYLNMAGQYVAANYTGK
jgi:hypothetical protein